MGFLDDAKKKLSAAVDKHGDKIGDGLDKAGQAIDKKTGGKYSDKIVTGVSKAKGALDDRKREDLSAAPRPSEPASPGPDVSPSQGDPNPVPSDPSPIPPEPGADPNEDIAAGIRPVPSGGPA